MEKSILNLENGGVYGYGTEEFSFAKVMPDSYWDSVASDEINKTERERLDQILDLIDEYY